MPINNSSTWQPKNPPKQSKHNQPNTETFNQTFVLNPKRAVFSNYTLYKKPDWLGTSPAK